MSFIVRSPMWYPKAVKWGRTPPERIVKQHVQDNRDVSVTLPKLTFLGETIDDATKRARDAL